MEYIIYDPERNLYVIMPTGYDTEFGIEHVYMTTQKSYATRFSALQVAEYINYHKAENPWLNERAEIQEAP